MVILTLENGREIMSITPWEEMKTMIEDDNELMMVEVADCHSESHWCCVKKDKVDTFDIEQ